MADPRDYSHELNLIKSIELVTALQKKNDLKVLRYLNEYKRTLEWKPFSNLMIEEEVWNYVVNTLGWHG